MKKLFVEFLKANGVYEAFVNNAYKDHRGTLEGIQGRHAPERWVQAGFDWSVSPEGLDYWIKIHQLWIHTLNTK